MIECSSCGTELLGHESRCPTCGKATPYYVRQKRCLHCGTPVAKQAKSCIMCGKPVDSLPLDTSIFSGSWRGIGLGVFIIVIIVMGVLGYQNDQGQVAQAVADSTTPAANRTPTAAITLTLTPTPNPSPTSTATPLPTPTPIVHIIESGDTLMTLSLLYEATVEEIAAFNSININETLHVGQELTIPRDSEEIAEIVIEDTPTPITTVYVVQEGDTISSIAYQNRTSIEAIEAANPDSDVQWIFPGQELVVPLSTPTPTGTPTPLPTATPTPGSAYPAPTLLTPTSGEIIDVSTLLLNWTSTTLLAADEFYVVQLTWLDGTTTEAWTKSNSLRITKAERPANGLTTWTVLIKRQTGSDPDGSPTGPLLSPPGKSQPFKWQ